ncbi:MAG TPA: zf-HC2 domain-containing protein [Candidatus Binatia bacterium]
MNCPEVQELFSDYLDERLEASQVSLLKEHLGACVSCRRGLGELLGTVELIGSLDEIETSPNFLAQVNRKIDRCWTPVRFWRWAFEPAKIKLPLEAAALAVVAIVAIYLYRSSEPLPGNLIASRESAGIAREQSQGAQLQRNGETPDQRALLAYKPARKERPPPLPELLAKKETPAPLPLAQAQRNTSPSQIADPGSALQQDPGASQTRPPVESLRKGAPPPASEVAAGVGALPAETASSGASPAQAKRESPPAAPARAAPRVAGVPMSRAPALQDVEVVSEDVTVSQRNVKAVLNLLGGRVLSERASGDDVMLTVELPQSREPEFRSVLKQETGKEPSAFYSLDEKLGLKFREQAQSGRTPPASQGSVREARRTAPDKEEPTVTLEIRIRPKK